MAPTAEETRDDQTLVAVVHRTHLEDGKVKDGINPGVVPLAWLKLGKNAEKWVEVPTDAESASAPYSNAPTPGSVADVLARVERGELTAADALAAETGEGGQNRSTLVTKLEALAAAGQEG